MQLRRLHIRQAGYQISTTGYGVINREVKLSSKNSAMKFSATFKGYIAVQLSTHKKFIYEGVVIKAYIRGKTVGKKDQ